MVRWATRWGWLLVAAIAGTGCGRHRHPHPASSGPYSYYAPNAYAPNAYAPNAYAPNAYAQPSPPYYAPLPATPPPSPTLPDYVRVSVLDATIGPAKMGGNPWDGPGSVSPRVIADVASALEALDPYAAVIGVLGSAAIDAAAMPDPYGTALLFTDNMPAGQASLQIQHQRDTLTPIWTEPPTWARIPLTAGTRIRVQLTDRDAIFDDPIGVAEINYSDLVTALTKQRVHHVRVAGQTNRQVLFIGISVMPAP